MLDSGSSVSLLKQEIVANTPGIVAGQQEPGLRLISAAGVDIPILDHVKAEVTVGNLVKSHNFFCQGPHYTGHSWHRLSPRA